MSSPRADILERWNVFNGVSVGRDMTETLKLPVLPLTDSVVLPGMVVPVRLDEPEIQAAVDAAGADAAVPRPRGACSSSRASTASTPRSARSPSSSRSARMPNGEKAAVVRGERRARIGSGVTGPGAALWVEAEPVTETEPTGRTHELAKEYKALVVGILQQRGAWQVIDSVQQIDRPRPARRHRPGWASYLDDRAEGPAARRDRRDRAPGAADRVDEGARRRAGGLREDLQRRPRGHGEDPARVPAAPAARRDPQGAGRGRARGRRRLPRPASSPPTCPSTSARPR